MGRPLLQGLVLLLLLLQAPRHGARKSSRAGKKPRSAAVDALTSSGRDPRGGAADPAAAAAAALDAVAADAASCGIDRLATIDVPSFLASYFQKKPLILTNASDNSAAAARWSLDYLSETYGQKKVSLGSPYAETVLEQPTRREKLGSFIARLRSGTAAGGAEYVWHTVSREFFNAEPDATWLPLAALLQQQQGHQSAPEVGSAVTVGGYEQLKAAWSVYDEWSDEYTWQIDQPATVLAIDDTDGTVSQTCRTQKDSPHILTCVVTTI